MLSRLAAVMCAPSPPTVVEIWFLRRLPDYPPIWFGITSALIERFNTPARVGFGLAKVVWNAFRKNLQEAGSQTGLTRSALNTWAQARLPQSQSGVVFCCISGEEEDSRLMQSWLPFELPYIRLWLQGTNNHKSLLRYNMQKYC